MDRLVKKQTGADASHIDFQPFPELDQSVRDDIATLRNSPLIPKTIEIYGGVYDVAVRDCFLATALAEAEIVPLYRLEKSAKSSSPRRSGST